jgi:hypothetical protein
MCAPISWRYARTIFLKMESVNTKVEDDARMREVAGVSMCGCMPIEM